MLGEGDRRTAVEGLARGRFGEDASDNGIQIAQHVACRYAQCLHAMMLQQSIAFGVTRRLVGAIMCFAIDLDAQFGSGAIEIEHIRSGRMLVAEFQAGRAIT